MSCPACKQYARDPYVDKDHNVWCYTHASAALADVARLLRMSTNDRASLALVLGYTDAAWLAKVLDPPLPFEPEPSKATQDRLAEPT